MLSHHATVNPHLLRSRINGELQPTYMFGCERIKTPTGTSLGETFTGSDQLITVKRYNELYDVYYGCFMFSLPFEKDTVLNSFQIKSRYDKISFPGFNGLRIYVEDNINPAPLVPGGSFSISNKVLLPDFVEWNYSAVLYDALNKYITTPDLKSLVNPLLSSSDWVKDRIVCFVIKPTLDGTETGFNGPQSEAYRIYIDGVYKDFLM